MNRHSTSNASKPLRSEFAANLALQAQPSKTPAIVFPPRPAKKG